MDHDVSIPGSAVPACWSVHDVLVFPSKRDRWLVAVLIGSALLALVAAAVLLVRPSWTGWLLAAWLLLSMVVMVSVLRTEYRVGAGRLVVQSGPFRSTIPLDEIVSVEPAWSLVAAPALSRDRLLILTARGRACMVSPQDRDGFLRALGTRKGSPRSIAS